MLISPSSFLPHLRPAPVPCFSFSAQILSTLGSSVKESRSTAALVIGKLAAIEVPRQLWNDLVPLLLHNVQAAPTKDLKQSTFEALGYVCEEVPDQLQAHSNGVLVAVASGMSADETDANVKLAATTALGNALEFIETNMSVEVRVCVGDERQERM